MPLLQQYDYVQRATITSFSPTCVRTVKELEPLISIALDPEGQDGSRTPWNLAQQVLSCGANFVLHDHRALTAAIVEEMHQHGFSLWAWTANKAEDMRRIIATGADGIMTDRPDNPWPGAGGTGFRGSEGQMTHIAVSTQLWGEELLGEKQLRLAAESGFRTLELFAAPGHFEWQDEAYVRKIAGILRTLGLGVLSLHAPWAPGQDIAALDKTQRQASIESVKRAVDDLALVQGQVLVLHPGATLEHPERKIESLRISRDSIAGIAEYCAVRGVKIALENPPPYELGGDNRDLLVLYRYFANEPTIQACFDTGHGQLSAQGISFVSLVPKDILLVHISDNGGRNDDHWPPSPKGTVPWSEFFGLLRARRFDQCLMLELTDLPGKTQILADGWTWMNNALRAIS